MKKTSTKSTKHDDMEVEYKFDCQKARPNRFAGKGNKSRTVVELDDDVAVVFSDAKTVNNALRVLITAIPPKAR